MAAFHPHPYLIRPKPDVAERFPDAWFGRPHVWFISSPGDHDFEGQQRLSEARLEIGVIAQIHEDALTVNGKPIGENCEGDPTES